MTKQIAMKTDNSSLLLTEVKKIVVTVLKNDSFS